MAERIGMGPSRVGDLQRVLARNTRELDGISHEIKKTALRSVNPIADMFVPGRMILTAGSIFLARQAADDILEAIAAAENLLGRLGVNIQEQLEASSATEGYLDGLMSKAQADALLAELATNPDALSEMTPQQIQAWWSRLSDAQRDEFVSDYHWIAGNTNGIPFERRIEANQYSAAEMLGSGDPMSDEQRLYLEAVVAGERNLISFDPSADRIIEMIGELGENTEHIVNYVPGTAATMEDFYDLSVQGMASELVERADPPGSTVAFVFKDCPFPTFDDRGVYHTSSAAAVGDPYYRFNTALGFENPGGLPVTSIEHSFGSSVGGYAEIQGTHFDQRIVLGGIGMSDGWKPDPGTEYYSFTGPEDIIRIAREKYSEDMNTGYEVPPTEENGFTELETGYSWAPEPNPNPWVIGIHAGDDPIYQHREVGGVNDNQVVIEQILELVD